MNIKTKALIAVMIGNAIFGFSFLFSKIALEITIPSVLIAVRFTVAFLVLNGIVLVGSRLKKSDGAPYLTFRLKGKPKKNLFLLALCQPIIYFIAENYGILYTSSAYAGILIAVIPIVSIVFDIVLLHSKVQKKHMVLAVCSVLGVVITTLGAQGMKSSVKGTLFLLVAVVASSLFYVFSKKSGEYYNPLERTYFMFGTGSIFYILFALVQSAGNYEKCIGQAFAQPLFWIAICYLSVFSSVIAFLLLNFGTNHVSVSQASLFANLSTVISIAAGILIMHETITPQQIAGAVIILVSVYFAGK